MLNPTKSKEMQKSIYKLIYNFPKPILIVFNDLNRKQADRTHHLCLHILVKTLSPLLLAP